MGYFDGRKAVIATKHQKNKVITPLLEHELGLICFTPENLNTDLLGTFSGEIERVDDPITAMKKKCLMAIDSTGINIAIATEGSFGPHPAIFFANSGDELIMLYDKDNDIEIIERELNLDTNFDATVVYSNEELIEFAKKIGFPSHGIILKKEKNDFSVIIKENRTFDDLIVNYNRIRQANGIAYAETDMRAMYNPTRMKNIEKAAKKLVVKAKSLCPECCVPGFGVVDSIKGLPCEICNFPTNSPLKHIFRCQKCHYETELLFPFGKKFEDPQYCDLCNP